MGWDKMARKEPTFLMVVFLVITTFSLFGCPAGGIPPSYVHQNFDLAFYQRIAVVPFENQTPEEFASSRLRQLMITELLLADVFEVVEPGEVLRALNQVQPTNPTSLSIEQIQKLGKELKAQGVLVGAVNAYVEHRFGSFIVPEVTATFRLIDVESGITVWSVTDTEGGLPVSTQLMGFRPSTMSEASRRLVRRVVDSLLF
jgi:TolB-like protein